MTKRIKHISELPNWFQLKKYDGAKKLDASGWYEQLIIRKNIIALKSDYTFKAESEKQHPYVDIFSLMRENPILNTTNDDILSTLFGDHVLTELKPKKPNYALGVHPLTLDELFILQHHVFPEKLNHIRKWYDLRKNFGKEKLNSKKIARYSYRPWFDDPIYKHSIITGKSFEAMVVNFDLPDNILIEHFKQFLATQRSKARTTSPKKLSRQPDFNDWIRFAILPYFDLQIWENETNVSIPNRVKADAIYPNGEGGEETVRKTTATLAEQLISSEQLSTLGAQAALEISEQNHR